MKEPSLCAGLTARRFASYEMNNQIDGESSLPKFDGIRFVPIQIGPIIKVGKYSPGLCCLALDV